MIARFDKLFPQLATLVIQFFLIGLSNPVLGQKPAQTKPNEPPDDVVRVNVDLVQTDVTVVDKRGQTITGLKPDQFELRVDSKLQSLAFLEEVFAGSAEEEKQLQSAREGKLSSAATANS